MTVDRLVVRDETALLSLCQAECRVDDGLVGSAKGEVAGRRVEHAALGVAWGYLLGMEREATETSFPAAWRLCDSIYRDVVRVIGDIEGADFHFSFCKAYSGPVIKEAEGVHYEGLHIDTHPDLDEATDLLRVLVNLGEHERRFRFGDATRLELARSGLYHDRASFRADHVEGHVPMRDVCIPGRAGSRVSFLVFLASVLPHVGITEAPGYFLFSFEAVVPSRWARHAAR
jgi:hypothetical protein